VLLTLARGLSSPSCWSVFDFDAATWHGGWDGLLLDSGGLDPWLSADDGGGSGRLKGGMALATDPTLKRLKWLLQLILFVGLYSVFRG
jgi:hypothetical protein